MSQRIRLAINGFGRIGRLTLRALLSRPESPIDVVAINDLGDMAQMALLLKYDSVHGRGDFDMQVGNDRLSIGRHTAKLFKERDPATLPWGAMDVDLVLDCTGRFVDREGASKHLSAGARKVLISAPGKNSDVTIVYGVNNAALLPEHRIVSNASCTTNCLAPMAKVLNDGLGLVAGSMTTVHAYTGDQSLVDGDHEDPRRARAAALSMIPTSTGAAKAIGLVLPELAGKLDGTAVRVPTPNVSMVDLSFIAARATSVAEVNDLLTTAASGSLAGILAATDLPLVSIDYCTDPHSCSVALDQTQVTAGTLVRVLGWYDNEWGFSNRMVDTASLMFGK